MRTPLAGTFRLFAAGQVLSVGGTWMMAVAQDRLVLALTGDPAAALGAATALQLTPVLLLTGVCALALAALVLAGAARLCLGTVNAAEVPTRMAFVSETAGAGRGRLACVLCLPSPSGRTLTCAQR
ncbi:hypothetical protein ACIQF5_31410 [Streptomyces goshikiensis]|uniref:hypothetical protein n=1 Tax=Streptomyces goshikiensis TaxID=1942 RepID=UPI00382A63C4